MDTTKSRRTTVYLNPDIHRALRLKAAETDRSVSDLVNDALREILVEDADDRKAFRDRADEQTVSFEEFVADLRRSGKL